MTAPFHSVDPVRRIATILSAIASFVPVDRAAAQCGGTWTQETTVVSPGARRLHAMAYDSKRGVTVVFGGVSDFQGISQALGDTWEWNGTNWVNRSIASPPPSRFSHTLTYDSARGVIVLFGGVDANNNYFDDTWEWDGTTWTEKTPATHPSARIAHGAAFDSARGVTVIFGGVGNNVPANNETWSWDGSNWAQLAVGGPAPSPRTDPGMAFDAARGVIVLFGGGPGGAETWVWDGTAWSFKTLTGASPSSRADAAMAYDSARGLTILYGGQDGAQVLGETWGWDGAAWTQKSPSPDPSPRTQSAMTYDGARDAMVLYAGIATSNLNNADDQTWEYVSPEPFVSEHPAPQTLMSGKSVTFTIKAGGQGTLAYRWRRNGSPLSDGGQFSGTATATLTIDPASDADLGDYDCQVSNACAVVVSKAAALSLEGSGTLAACGLCGVGMTAVMPIALLALCMVKRQRRKG